MESKERPSVPFNLKSSSLTSKCLIALSHPYLTPIDDLITFEELWRIVNMGKKQLFRILRLVFSELQICLQELEYSIYKHIIDKVYSSEPNCNRSVLDWKTNITILNSQRFIFLHPLKRKSLTTLSNTCFSSVEIGSFSRCVSLIPCSMIMNIFILMFTFPIYAFSQQIFN